MDQNGVSVPAMSQYWASVTVMSQNWASVMIQTLASITESRLFVTAMNQH